MNDASLLPPNATPLEITLESVTARVGDVPTPLRDLWSAQNCPENLLPWLAWALGIDAWKSYWPLEVKRARVATAINIARQKGTAQSVRDVVAAFGGAVDLREWFQQSPPGDPYTFDMTLTVNGRGGEEATSDYVDDVIAEVERTMPVRCHYTFTQGSAFASQIGIACVARPVVYIDLSFYAQAAQ